MDSKKLAKLIQIIVEAEVAKKQEHFLTKIFPKILEEEVNAKMVKLLKETKSKTPIQTTTKTKELDPFALAESVLQKERQQTQNKPTKEFTKNPVLNEILNQTQPFSSAQRSGLGGGTSILDTYQQPIQEAASYVPSYMDAEPDIDETFTFNNPIYLKPGQYSLMLATDSKLYNVYASKVGETQFGTGRLVSQVTYSGSLFRSQNASTWVAAPNEQLAFKLNICDFAGGQASFDTTSIASNPAIEYDLLNLMTQDLTFSNYGSIGYKMLTVDKATSVQSGEVNVFANENNVFNTRQIHSANGNIIIRSTIGNVDKWTSPVVDLERLNAILVKNNITNYVNESSNTALELLPGFGNNGSIAKYITKRVTLNNNFDSSGLTVFLDVNRRPGTKIEVYYKVLNSNDQNSFDSQPYVLMNPKFTVGGSLESTGVSDYITDTYQALNITYSDVSTGSVYTNFKVFAIKIVMYSDNPAIVPRIKNFRAIATA